MSVTPVCFINLWNSLYLKEFIFPTCNKCHSRNLQQTKTETTPPHITRKLHLPGYKVIPWYGTSKIATATPTKTKRNSFFPWMMCVSSFISFQIDQLSHQIAYEVIEFRPARLFLVDNRMILSIFAVIISYLLILIQFDMTEWFLFTFVSCKFMFKNNSFMKMISFILIVFENKWE